jgi:hypothetical protein
MFSNYYLHQLASGFPGRVHSDQDTEHGHVSGRESGLPGTLTTGDILDFLEKQNVGTRLTVTLFCISLLPRDNKIINYPAAYSREKDLLQKKSNSQPGSFFSTQETGNKDV